MKRFISLIEVSFKLIKKQNAKMQARNNHFKLPLWKITKLGLFLISFPFFINSCSPPLYHPNVANVPMLNNKGEVNAAAHIGSSGFNPQVAFAVTDNIGIMANGAFLKETKAESKDYHSVYFIEGGAGYFKKVANVLKVEAYGGYGVGNNELYYHEVLDESTNTYGPLTEYVKYSRIFIQPSFSFNTNVFDAGIAPRFSFVNINDEGPAKRLTAFFEPTLTTKFGIKHVNLVLQIGYSIPFDNYYGENLVNHKPLIASFGLQANINRK